MQGPAARGRAWCRGWPVTSDRGAARRVWRVPWLPSPQTRCEGTVKCGGGMVSAGCDHGQGSGPGEDGSCPPSLLGQGAKGGRGRPRPGGERPQIPSVRPRAGVRRGARAGGGGVAGECKAVAAVVVGERFASSSLEGRACWGWFGQGGVSPRRECSAERQGDHVEGHCRSALRVRRGQRSFRRTQTWPGAKVRGFPSWLVNVVPLSAVGRLQHASYAFPSRRTFAVPLPPVAV